MFYLHNYDQHNARCLHATLASVRLTPSVLGRIFTIHSGDYLMILYSFRNLFGGLK
ncbi:hypothetical protein E2C01_077007 [Portunus trituberculatus]|uniref:Uncharacterized protein n=1 Tax=Portunus trituberculatus TaxID=210409 RepID=A0A5B7INF2_PORTR|nr:hypothetical protein [Portunus trituberculatus]